MNIQLESAARMRMQNQFQSGLDIARYTASIMRKDMDEYDANPEAYTQSLGWQYGFIGQQKLISLRSILVILTKRASSSSWMVAALRSEFGPLPDQSMHEKTTVASLIEELYTFLKQADARELETSLDSLILRKEKRRRKSKTKLIIFKLTLFQLLLT